MTKAGAGPHVVEPAEHREPEATQGDDDRQPGQRRQLPAEEPDAGVPLDDGGLVVRWGAVHRRRDPDVRQHHVVIPGGRLGLAGETGPPQRPVEPLPRPIAAEHPAGPVGPVGRGGQTHHRHRGQRIPPAGHASTPVLLVGIGGTLLAGDPLAPLDQPRTRPTLRHLVGDCRQGAGSLGLDVGGWIHIKPACHPEPVRNMTESLGSLPGSILTSR